MSVQFRAALADTYVKGETITGDEFNLPKDCVQLEVRVRRDTTATDADGVWKDPGYLGVTLLRSSDGKNWVEAGYFGALGGKQEEVDHKGEVWEHPYAGIEVPIFRDGWVFKLKIDSPSAQKLPIDVYYHIADAGRPALSIDPRNSVGFVDADNTVGTSVTTLENPNAVVVSGSNKAIYAQITYYNGATRTVSSSKWGGSGGADMTSVQTTTVNASMCGFDYRMLDSGISVDAKVYVTMSGSCTKLALTVWSWNNVDQTTPEDDLTGTRYATGSITATANDTLNTASGGRCIFQSYAWVDYGQCQISLLYSPTTTEINNSGNNPAAGSQHYSAAGSTQQVGTTVNSTYGYGNAYILGHGLALNEASAGGPTNYDRTIAEAVTVNDVALPFRERSRQLIEAVDAADVLGTARFLYRALVDATTVNDATIPQLGRLEVSSSARYLERGGQPFFWLADTAWRMTLISRESVDQYMADRAAKGFNMIQGPIVLKTPDFVDMFPTASYTPNYYGDEPFDVIPVTDSGEATFNEAYLEHLDYIIMSAARHGLHICPAVVWGSTIDFIVTDDTLAAQIGEQLAARYAHLPHVTWIACGEYQKIAWNTSPSDDLVPDSTQLSLLSSIAEGLKTGDANVLVTFHPEGFRTTNEYMHTNAYIDFGCVQTFTVLDEYSGYSGLGTITISTLIADMFDATSPVLPIINTEPGYEGRNGGSLNDPVTPHQVRYEAWHSVLQGAFGAAYGNWDVWDFGTGWESHLDDEGGTQMTHIKALMETLSVFGWEHDQSIVLSNVGDYESLDMRRAAVSPSDDYAVIYFPDSEISSNIDTSWMAGSDVAAWWYNPRDGLFYKPGDTDYVVDTFTDSDSTALGSHDPDVDVEAGGWSVSGSGSITITSNKAVISGSNVIGVIDSGVADLIEIRVKYTPVSGGTNRGGIYFRGSDANNCWVLAARQPNGDLILFKRTAGSGGSVVASVSKTWVDDTEYELTVKLDGTKMYFYIDGVHQDMDYATSDYQSGTVHGFGSTTVSGGQVFEDFSVTSMIETTASAYETFAKSSSKAFQGPAAGDTTDWVLLLLSSGGVIYDVTLSDSVSVTDAPLPTRERHRQTTDGVTVADAIARFAERLRTARDGVDATDSLATYAERFARTLDNVSVADALTTYAERLRMLIDTTTAVDDLLAFAATSAIEVVLTDSITVTDLVERYALRDRVLVDEVTAVDTIAAAVSGLAVRLLSDSIAVSDALLTSRAVDRLITEARVDVTDVIGVARGLARVVRDEGLTVTDQVLLQAMYERALTDAITSVLDSVLLTKRVDRTLADAVTVVDLLSSTIPAVVGAVVYGIAYDLRALEDEPDFGMSAGPSAVDFDIGGG